MSENMLDQMDALLDHIDSMREWYGLEPNRGVPPTFEEIRAAEDAEVDRLVEEIVRFHAGKNDLTGWTGVWYNGRPNHKRNLPYFLMSTAAAECWDPETEAEMTHAVWTLVEWPGGNGYNPYWHRQFARAGFQCDAEDCDVDHTQPVTVYRGAFASEKRGLAWTLDRERAEWFAGRGDMSGKGKKMRLYRCEVPADRVYAHHVGRGEDEIVCDVRGLKIEVVE